MAPTRKKRRKRPADSQPRFTAHSLGALVDLTLMTATPEQIAQIEETAAQLSQEYSLKNRVAIAVQLPGAHHVHGGGTWRKLGYRIGKGQKGLATWYRRSDRSKDDSDQNKETPTPETGSEQPTQEEPSTPARRYSGFGINYLWDISQVVPKDCECEAECGCRRPPLPPITPAGPAADEFADMVAAAAEHTDTDGEA